MEEQNYIQILEDSLRSKIDLLRRLQALSVEQSEILKDPNALPEAFEENIEKKEQLIQRLSGLDQGFDAFFDKVKDELDANRMKYRDAIARMQDMIREITSLSSGLQVLEKQNSELARSKFSQIRTQTREIRQNRKAVNSYYKNMMKMGTVDPQFMDSKK